MPNLNIEIPEEVHRRIKILAATEGRSLKELVIKALEESASEGKRR